MVLCHFLRLHLLNIFRTEIVPIDRGYIQETNLLFLLALIFHFFHDPLLFNDLFTCQQSSLLLNKFVPLLVCHRVYHTSFLSEDVSDYLILARIYLLHSHLGNKLFNFYLIRDLRLLLQLSDIIFKCRLLPLNLLEHGVLRHWLSRNPDRFNIDVTIVENLLLRVGLLLLEGRRCFN